jgi:hypothetical protein
MRRRALVAAATVALVAAVAHAQAQAPGMGTFRGKIKEGLYEIRSEADLGNTPGIPPANRKQTATMQQCLGAKEIDGFAEEKQKDCQTRNLKVSGDAASFQIFCGKGDMISDVAVKFVPGGYTMESKATVKPAGGGAPITMSSRAESKYIGPCKK